MKTYAIIRILWLPALGFIYWIKPYATGSLNWICKNPTLWTPELGYLPITLISLTILLFVVRLKYWLR